MQAEYKNLLLQYALLNKRLHDGKETLPHDLRALLIKQRYVIEQYLRILEERAKIEKVALLGKENG